MEAGMIERRKKRVEYENLFDRQVEEKDSSR